VRVCLSLSLFLVSSRSLFSPLPLPTRQLNLVKQTGGPKAESGPLLRAVGGQWKWRRICKFGQFSRTTIDRELRWAQSSGLPASHELSRVGIH